MTLEEKIKEINDRDIPDYEKLRLIVNILFEDLFSTINDSLKGVSDNDRLSEDSDRESQAVQDNDKT